MKLSSITAGIVALAFAATVLVPIRSHAQDSQEGPQQPSDSVAKPRKKPDAAPEPDKAPIPSEYKKKDVPENTPTFTANATTVSVNVAVLDDRGRFIPKIPRGNFRVYEDGVPQHISVLE
jgi:Ca-activated chloride channel family protein